MMKRLHAATIALLLLSAGCRSSDTPDNAASAAPAAAAADNLVPLRVHSGTGRHVFAVELAVDKQSQQQGLMGRTDLADDRGMLFPYPYPEMASFWMKNTPLPLDLIFIRPDGTIAAILPGTPNDLRPISPGEPVSAVLEIRQGRAQALGLKAGDRVDWGDCAAPVPDAGAWRADRFCPAA